MSTPFQTTYSTLNPRQKQAVDTLYGPVLVIAGPGSGKTQILSARIANILLQTDVNPSNILCLTFTDNAAKNMRERLSRVIGADAYKVAIHTFHSFGNEILNRYRSRISDYAEATPIDDIEASRLFDEILTALPWNDPYKPGMNANEKIRELRNAIKLVKDAGITPSEYAEIIETNRKTMAVMEPLIRAHLDELLSLGQKKEDKIRKLELFRVFHDALTQAFSGLPERMHSQDTFARTLLDSLDAIWSLQESETDAKIVTKWRDEWLEKDYEGKWILKDASRLEKYTSLARIYVQYEERMKALGYIDFSDMILGAIRLVEQYGDIRANLAEQYQFVLVDEYQDTNDAQLRLITDILGVAESPNVFAVGDDDQSIYKFQGANTKNIKAFRDRWADTELIILETNYRSNSEIIDTSRSLMNSASHSIGDIFPGAVKSFDSHHGQGGSVTQSVFETEADELTWVAADIERAIADGFPAEEIAVITKKNKTLENLAKVLLSKWIPVALSKDENIFDSEEVRLVDEILEYLVSLRGNGQPRDEVLLSILAHPCWGIHRLTIWEMSKKIYNSRPPRESSQKRSNLSENWAPQWGVHSEGTTNEEAEIWTQRTSFSEFSYRKSWIEALRTHTDPALAGLANFLIELSILSHHARLEDLMDYITGANALAIPDEYDEDPAKITLQIDMFGGGKKEYISPIYGYYFGTLTPSPSPSDERGVASSSPSPLKGEGARGWGVSLYARHLANIRKLVESVRSFKKWSGFLSILDYGEFISLMKKYDVQIAASHLVGHEGTAVNLITVHKAKGLEYGRVYAIGLTEKQYKLGKVSGSPLPKNLPLAPEKDDDEDIRRLVYTVFTRAKKDLVLSYARMNLNEKSDTPLGCLTDLDPAWTGGSIGTESLVDFLEKDRKDLFSLPYHGEERNFLADRIAKQFTMSVTALQNFLNVADGGPEHFVANNILRFPQAKSEAACYGSAMHKALEVFFTDYKKTGLYSKSTLLSSFETAFKQERFSENTERDFLDRGRENLGALYSEITGKAYGDLHLEYDFRTAFGGIFLDGIQLTGKIDRIEVVDNQKLIITDYKTGGGFDSFSETGSAYEKIKKWKYKLQFCFYAVLFELSPQWARFQQKEFALVFIEQDRKTGRFVTVTDYVQQGEIERTKALVRAVMSKIHALDFPDVSAYSKDIAGIRQFEEDLLGGEV